MDLNVLIKSPLFRGMDISDVESALSGVPYRIRRYKSGSQIALAGETVRSFIIVISGVVKGEMTDISGRVIKIEDISAPGALASAFLFGSENVFPVNVVAIADTQLLTIEKTDFLKFLKNNEKILTNFLDIISNRSQFLSEKIKFLNFKTIKGKLAQYILEETYPDKIEMTFPLTQNEMAEYFGVTRPSIARVLSELEDLGIIVTRGKKLTILDRRRLGQITSE